MTCELGFRWFLLLSKTWFCFAFMLSIIFRNVSLVLEGGKIAYTIQNCNFAVAVEPNKWWFFPERQWWFFQRGRGKKSTSTMWTEHNSIISGIFANWLFDSTCVERHWSVLFWAWNKEIVFPSYALKGLTQTLILLFNLYYIYNGIPQLECFHLPGKRHQL